MRQFALLTLLTLTSLVHANTVFSFLNEPGPYPVGLKVVQRYDYSRVYKWKVDMLTGQPAVGERARPIQALIWYPAQKGGKKMIYKDYATTIATEENFSLNKVQVNEKLSAWLGNYVPGITDEQVKKSVAQEMWAVQDAKSVSGKFPLIVYAPSLSSNAFENVDLCEYLASQGYVVISSADMGSRTRGMTDDLEGIEAQVADIEYLIGYAKQNIHEADTSHIAVIGYSWGGISNVFAAAKDDRISAIVSLDGSVRYFPAIVSSAKYVTPARVKIPFLFVASKSRPIEDQLKYKADLTSSFLNDMKYSDVYKVIMHPMRHGDFASLFLRFEPLGDDTDYSIDEISLAHSWVARYVNHFLNAYLKNDSTSLTFLNNTPARNKVPAHMMSVDVHHSEGEPATLENFVAAIGQRGFTHAEEIYEEMHKKDANFKLDANGLNSWGYELMQGGRIKESIAILSLVPVIYPESGNGYDSLAEAYEKNNEKEQAIKNYRRSLELDPKNDNAVQHLKSLGAPVAENFQK